MSKIWSLAIVDFKLIFRDSSLRLFLILPVVLFGLIVYVLPIMADDYPQLAPYLIIFLMVGVIENTQAFCFINSMVLVDEKENNIAIVYGVTPLSKFQYLTSRFLLPFGFTFFLNVMLLAFQPFFEIGISPILILSFLAAMIVPIYVLAVNSVAMNRMQSMIYIKAFNMVLLLPIAVFFMSNDFGRYFGIFPTYWLFKIMDNMSINTSIVLPAIICVLFLTILLTIVSNTFLKRHFLNLS
jgi:fluoroquinolone transport system permease protein